MRSGRGRVARRPASGRIRSQGRRRAPGRRASRRPPPALPDAAALAAALAAGVGELLGPDAASEAQLGALAAYARLLERWSRAYNLVGPSALPELVPRHLLDSLRLAPLLPGPGGAVLDLGTGAGLPGLPLAVLRPDLSFTLLDRSRKKIRFVRQALLELGLGHARAEACDAAEHAGGPYAAIVARAVGPAAALARLAGRLLAPGGTLLLPGGAPAALPAGWRAELRELPAAPGGRTEPALVLRRADPRP